MSQKRARQTLSMPGYHHGGILVGVSMVIHESRPLAILSFCDGYSGDACSACAGKFSAGVRRKYFHARQQRDLGIVDGFIEEMMDGQKVVKVFCHEEAAKADFHKVNDALRDSADKANRYANLLMPINNNIGWLSYAVIAIVGSDSGD